tara:strand:- start:206 stop:643 length:438 start_codon:yes stop_codon:yes gene_type:complete
MAYYGTVDGGDLYHSLRLHNGAWTTASDNDKVKALTMATTLIDNLAYEYDKTVSTQELEFPRGTDTSVPEAIEKATYELALTLLDNDPAEHDPRITTAKLGAASVSYDTSFVPQYVSAGIPSKAAWAFLKPYLRDNMSISLERIN